MEIKKVIPDDCWPFYDSLEWEVTAKGWARAEEQKAVKEGKAVKKRKAVKKGKIKNMTASKAR